MSVHCQADAERFSFEAFTRHPFFTEVNRWIVERVIGPFFFSSRRRHTRSLCDWSSDVCSSDLGEMLDLAAYEKVGGYEALRKGLTQAPKRSEERRVGKECRSRWSPDDSKKNTTAAGGPGRQATCSAQPTLSRVHTHLAHGRHRV